MYKLLSYLTFALLALITVSGCSSVSVSEYAGRTPALELESFFNGELTAHGIVKNRSGKVIRYFNAEIKAYWDEGVGTLEEDFIFDDGEKQRRVWKLVKQQDGSYIGTAGDVVGEGRAEVAGNSMFLDYILEVAYGDGSINLAIDDRMYLVQPNILINESAMTKFGFRVGEIVLVIKRQSD
ncbi:MAG: DUF3833 domain-containing protein [Thermodesulfobacteriota bacterium]